MGFGFKHPLVGEKRCVTTLITAAKETRRMEARISFTPFLFTPLLRNGPIVRQLYSSNILMFYSPSKISDFLELTFHEIFFPCFFYSGYQSQRLPVTRAPQRFFPISKTKFWWTSIKCFHDNIVVFISCQFRGHVRSSLNQA